MAFAWAARPGANGGSAIAVDACPCMNLDMIRRAGNVHDTSHAFYCIPSPRVVRPSVEDY
ncbi:hypothetical protein E2562_014353 [Oryza meyeriana var. granulata]|uniref:Uncharacterized protein n=1 Tax=Oryza meyeriana var. granulata TaxID=110450 RepID=A0A6G1C7G8_9ORYZ|nr:hypothetical protein E2562_014353 [Oryza meyeriana var. granulata]